MCVYVIFLDSNRSTASSNIFQQVVGHGASEQKVYRSMQEVKAGHFGTAIWSSRNLGVRQLSNLTSILAKQYFHQSSFLDQS